MDSSWISVEGTLDKLPVSILLLSDIQPLMATGLYNSYLQIDWHFNAAVDGSPGRESVPSDKEIERVEKFQELLQQHLCASGEAVIVYVITSPQLRQWLLYTKGTDQAVGQLNRIPTEQGAYPIEVIADSDPHWQCYHQIADKVRKSSH